ncbi:MAG: DUF4160 domain-containing protein [bacterium]
MAGNGKACWYTSDASPTISRIGPYRFFFNANEGAEPAHVHVQRERMLAKFWLEPAELELSVELGVSELNALRKIVEGNASAFRESWKELFGH